MPPNNVRKKASASPTPNSSKASDSGETSNTFSSSFSRTRSNRPSSSITRNSVGADTKTRKQTQFCSSDSEDDLEDEQSDNEQYLARRRPVRTCNRKKDDRNIKKASSSHVTQKTFSSSVSRTGTNRPSSSGIGNKTRKQTQTSSDDLEEDLRDKKSDDEQYLATRRPVRTCNQKQHNRNIKKNANVRIADDIQKQQQQQSPKQATKRRSTLVEPSAKRTKTTDSTDGTDEKTESIGTKRTRPQPIPNEYVQGPCEVPHVVCRRAQHSFWLARQNYNYGPPHEDAKAILVMSLRKIICELKEHLDTQKNIRESGLDVDNCFSDWDETDAGMNVMQKYTGRMELAHSQVTIKFLEFFIAEVENETWDGDLICLTSPNVDPGIRLRTARLVKDLINGIKSPTEFRRLLGAAGSHHKRLERLFRPTPWTAAKVIEDALKYAQRKYFPKGKYYQRLLSNVLNNISYNVGRAEWEIQTYRYENLFRVADSSETDLPESNSK